MPGADSDARDQWFGGGPTFDIHLAAGENELVVAVAETFGGWGLQARLPEGQA